MKITHWMRKENSGLTRTTCELAKYEARQGHEVCIREPNAGQLVFGRVDKPDIHCIHSQILPQTYHDGIPKIMWMHGEPLSSVGNGISMKAICDLAPVCEAFIAMRKEEVPIWDCIRRTHLVTKGIDLEVFKPLDGVTERLEGSPAVLYIENWRGQRNPLTLCVAMQIVHQKYPDARLHLFNCKDKKMKDTFSALAKQCKWWPFLRTISGPVDAGEAVNLLYNRVDMVVSCLHPLYARGIEALAAGKAFIGPGYKPNGYPFTCDLDPHSMAYAITRCWEDMKSFNFREWAEQNHNVADTVQQSVRVYERYLK